MKGSDKINQVLVKVKLNPTSFAKAIGLNYAQNIYDIQKDKINISKSVALKIVSKYPEFSERWLLFGEGEMLKTEYPTSQPASLLESDVTIPYTAESPDREVRALQNTIDILLKQIDRKDNEIQMLHEYILKQAGGDVDASNPAAYREVGE